MRSGLKSRASIEVETSISSTMSMPSVSTFSKFLESRGRAMATISSARAAMRSTNGKCRSARRSHDGLYIHLFTAETCSEGASPFISL